MHDDYLWDRSGPPDPEVARLEGVLGRLRSNPPAPELPARVVRFPRLLAFPGIPSLRAVAAGVLLLLTGTWVVTRPPKAAWDVARLDGLPKVGSEAVGRRGSLEVGEWLETDAASRAQIKVGSIGQVDVEPNTRIRLLQARWTNHRLALQRGEIHARIWAPPRLFFVETPSAVAVDLGCAYSLKVDDEGASLLHVSHGWVSFELAGRESFVPAGASCVTRPGIGPGTPYYEDAPENFRAALTKLDFENGGPELLDIIVAESRRRDVLTMWHLLPRVSETDRGRLFDRMAALVEVPKEVTREAVVKAEKHILQIWWDDLAFDQTGWWQP